MSWFKRTAKPSRPPEVIEPQRIDFVGEQAGSVEDGLEIRFREVFAATPTVQSAYLARLSYGEASGHSVGLCIRSSVGIDQRLQKRLAQIFAEVFRADEHLDILFIREDQEAALRKVCKTFYERG
jgi:SseB protein C-terminal domain